MTTTTQTAPSPQSPTPTPQPNLDIRARPPSPKRLSRKVLLGSAIAIGAVVAFSLLSGLSDNRPGRSEAAQEAVAASGGPPDSIAQASSDYAAGDLPRGQIELGEEVDLANASGEGAALAPPQDPMWTNASSPQGAVGSAAPPAPSPQDVARTSPILFNASAERARASPTVADDDADARLNARLTPPGSRYEIKAGDTIPAALVTALNSDLPGRVIAQVTAPVYDSVSGDHLLIPQGSRLLGAYESGVRYGDHRILLVWNRLVLPNGWSINLREMNATDGAGASGLQDQTDNHLDRLGVAIGLSAIISVIANESENDDEESASLSQSVGDAAAAQAASTGGRIVDRELTVRPTLRVRAGAPVRVLITRDIQLRPYAGPRR